MQNSIRLPILRLEAVETVSKLNQLIQTYANNDDVLTVEKLEEIFQYYNGNVLKYFELTSVLMRHIMRTGNLELYAPLIAKIRNLVGDLQPEEAQRAINIFSNDLRYIGTLGPVQDISQLQSELQLMINQLRAKLAGSSMTDKDSAQMENMFNTMTGTDMHFSALLDAMLEMCQEFQQEMVMQESIATTARKVTDKITNTVVKYTIRDKEMSEQLNDKFNRYLSEYKENKKIGAYDKIVKDSFNLSKMLKSLIGSSIIALFIPGGVQVKIVAAVIMILIKFTLDKRTEAKHKQIILADLKFEKTILDEKIKDAESKSDSKAKYQLMRTQNEVSRAIDRIQYGLAQN